MKLFVNQEIKKFFLTLSAIWAAFLLLAEGMALQLAPELSLWLLLFSLLAAGGMGAAFFGYFSRQNRLMEQAVVQIQAYLAGNTDARLECDEEGELYRLFHEVNSLAAVLNAHAENEQREKEFLKNTISDISHQLKTPLAALNIYNGLLQEESEASPSVKEFAALSEQELDRMETLVQNLLKIARLDAGSITLEKTEENVAELMRDVELHFAYRADQEGKTLVLSGPEDVSLLCDRDWMLEAVDNLVKNALDHTKKENTVWMEWKALPSMVRIRICDDGEGIHPEDLPHIFKRFYRSRFSQSRQGIGLGLPLAKAIVEAHGGTLEVDSELGRGTTFTMNFRIPTKL